MTELLAYVPEQPSYSVQHPNQVISIELDGGAPRLRADTLRASGSVSVSWLLDRQEYTDFMTFWRVNLEHGALPCLVDLVTDYFQLVRHRATFTPGSLRTSQVAGLTYRVSAELRVEQLFSFFATHSFISPDVVQSHAVVNFLTELQNPTRIQIINAKKNDGVNPPIDLDGFYTVDTYPTLDSIKLVNPSAPNPDWSLLASYPGSTSGAIGSVIIVNSPT